MVQGSTPGGSRRLLFSPRRPVRLWGSPAPLFSGYRGSLVGRERPGHAADHSPSSRAEVKNRWRYNSTPPICLHGVDRENFTFIYVTRHSPAHHRLANDNLTNQRTCVVWFYERHPPVVMNLTTNNYIPVKHAQVIVFRNDDYTFRSKKDLHQGNITKALK